MRVENRRQLENTRTKLQKLVDLFATTEHAPSADQHVCELTVCALKKRINRFKEEITRFEARVSEAARKG